jgi:predicted deacetylase
VLPTEPRHLCVSIHDVAPATWDGCEQLARAIREVADIPVTWLVVPRYHERADRSAQMEAGLSELVARGHELSLHGYTHLDPEPVRGSAMSRFWRGVYTTREGEFSALSEDEARRRIRLGLDWFAERGWPVSGFVAPAWLLGDGAWRAVRSFAFEYTTTFSRFHLLRAGSSIWSPSLVYAARNRAGRVLSPLAADAIAPLLVRAPLVRLSLHPPDAQHPRLLLHAQRTIEQLLRRRVAVTKAACARALAGAVTSTDRAIPDHRRSSTGS